MVDWWIDNGARKHIINYPNLFVNFRVFKDSRCILAAGKEALSTVGQRTIQIKSTVGEETQLLINLKESLMSK